MPLNPGVINESRLPVMMLGRCGLRIVLVVAVTVLTALTAGISLAPLALADSASNLREALTSARGGMSCGPLHSDPVVEQVAAKINQSTEDYLDHTATQVPIEDPLPGLKILGYGGKAKLIQGAGKTEADAIKGLLLEGYDKIPDCSYTAYGASMQRNERTDWYLAVVVLAGA